MSCDILRGLTGIVAGSIIILAIQFTIGNPFIWIDDKIQEYKNKRRK